MGLNRIVIVHTTNKAEDYDDHYRGCDESDHLTTPLRFISQRYQLG